MNIGKFSVRNPVLVNISIVALLVLGGLSLGRLPREQFSEVPFFWVNVIVPYPGVSAEDIEQAVTVPVENEMQGIDSLSQIQSVTSEGLSVVRVEFEDGISNDEFDRLYQDVRTRFARVELPEGTLQAAVDDFSSTDFLPVIEVVVAGSTDYSVIAEEARLLSDRLRRINQVSGVDAVGLKDRQVVIRADRNKLESIGLSMNELIRAVGSRNVTVPGGSLGTETREYLLRTVGRMERTEDFGNIIVRRGESGVVHIRDIATIEEGYDPAGIDARFNGEEAIVLRINKVPRGNSVGVIEDVKAEVARYMEAVPPGVRVELTGDSTVQIRESIRILLNNAIFGLALLTLILFLFIGIRNALMTALGIPVTFAVTFIVLEALGETFNTNTLFGMVLVLGLIVDHAIVISENSFRLQQEGMSRKEAAEKGVNQVVGPVVAATATTIAAFLPLMILPGTIGKFLRVIPLTVSIALAASTFESVVFLPAHFAEWPGGGAGKRGGKLKKLRILRKNRFEGFRKWFEGVLERVYTRRKLAAAIMIFLALGGCGLVPALNQDLFSAEDFTLFYIDLELAPGTPKERTNRVVKGYEDRIIPSIGNGEVVSVTSSVGFSSGDDGNSVKSNVAQITVDLTERDQGRVRSITEIMDEVRRTTADIPGTEEVLFRKAQNGPPTDPPVSFRLFGDSYGDLEAAAEEITDALAGYPVLLNIQDNLEKGTPELRIRLLPERAAALGLDALALGTFIRDVFDGRTVTTFFRDNQQIDVIVTYARKESFNVFELDQIMIPAPDGRQIPFSSVARIEQGEALAGIKRVDGKREITITAEAYSDETVPEINRDIEALFESRIQTRYPDLVLNVGGEFAELNNLLIQILRVFLIGIFLIYLILGVQFKSYLKPLLILLTVPFSFFGVILYLFMSGTPFSTTVLYAAVALAGIAVNDSIVLISFINERREEGLTVKDAVIEAAGTRLRPIILTSLTTIAGLLPTAVGIGGKSVVWSPMASTIVFGLVFSTITALLVIPAFYGLFFDRAKAKAAAADA